MAELSFLDFCRLPPFGNIAPRKVYEVQAQQILPVIHLAIEHDATTRPVHRIVFDFVLWVLLEGEMEFIVNDERHVIGPFGSFLIPPFVPHTHSAHGKRRARHLAFHFDIAYDVPQCAGRLSQRTPYAVKLPRGMELPQTASFSSSDELMQLAMKMPTLHTTPDGPLAVESSAILHAMLSILFRQSPESRKRHSLQTRHAQQVGRAVAYAREHFRARPDLGVDELARAAGVSRSGLEHLFKESTGQPPMAFVRELRVMHARELLADPELMMKEISQRCGFTDLFHFSRVFKRVTGKSPSDYRNRLIANTDGYVI